MPKGTRIVVEDSGYGLGTIDGFRANVVGANNHCVRFDNCQSCAPGGGGCKSCRKSLQLRGMRWKYSRQVEDQRDDVDTREEMHDGSMHDDTELPKGTRVAVLDCGYGVATVVGFESALIGANTHEVIYDNCYHCVDNPDASSGDYAAAAVAQLPGDGHLQHRAGCEICRRLIKLKGASWKVVSEDAPTSDQAMAPGTRVAVFDQGYGLATIDGFRSNIVGHNNFSMVFDSCVMCKHSEGCGVCRKSLKLKDNTWQLLMVDGSIHRTDTELPKGTRVVVEDRAYGLATIDGFRSNMIGANNHSMVFDNCQSCPAGSVGCGSCRKSLQLKGTPWKILLKDGSSHDDTQMPVGTRVLVENAAYGVATISGFTSALFGANTHEMVFDNCPACAQKRKKGCSLCRKALKLKGIEWSQLDRSELAQRARAQPRWVEDDEQQVCMLCDAEFGSMTRQHHCRCCGWVVCAGCCPEGQMIELDRWVSSSEGHPIKRAAQVAGTPTKHKRVCNICLRAAPLEVEERRRALAGVDEGIPPA